MAIYLKFGNINGPVTTEGFPKWIELQSFKFKATRKIGTGARSAISREHNEPSFDEVEIKKLTDVASPKLFLDSVAGKLDNKVIIKFTTTTKGKVETYLTFQFEDTGISHYEMFSGDGGMPTEILQLNYIRMSKTFTGMDPGISGSPETVGYDLGQMKTT